MRETVFLRRVCFCSSVRTPVTFSRRSRMKGIIFWARSRPWRFSTSDDRVLACSFSSLKIASSLDFWSSVRLSSFTWVWSASTA